MKLVATVIAVLLVGALAIGCGAGVNEPQVPTTAPSIRGVVTSVEPSGGPAASMRVVWTDDSAVGVKAAYDAAQVGIDDETDILRRVDGAYEAAGPADLKVGTIAWAWFTGAVAESYPVQAKASTIVIEGEYDGTLPVPSGL